MSRGARTREVSQDRCGDNPPTKQIMRERGRVRLAAVLAM
eukprot:COSAG01_NODE_33673_length_560_cov_2.130152_1_plen_39_part_10